MKCILKLMKNKPQVSAALKDVCDNGPKTIVVGTHKDDNIMVIIRKIYT